MTDHLVALARRTLPTIGSFWTFEVSILHTGVGSDVDLSVAIAVARIASRVDEIPPIVRIFDQVSLIAEWASDVRHDDYST
jgi:hypothetical protein